MAEIEISGGNRGFATVPNVGVMTFEVEGLEAREDIRINEFKSIYNRYASDNSCVHIENFWVPMWGEGHNLYPQEVYSLISENKLLPSVIEKQVNFLYGKGPQLFKEVLSSDGKIVRQYVSVPEVKNWLTSWEENGYPPVEEYLKNIITDFYYVKTCCSQYHFSKSRRLGNSSSVIALSYVGSDEARLAAEGNFIGKRVKASDCSYVMLGDWMNLGGTKFDVFNRFSPVDPLRYPEPIAFNSEKTFSKWVYAYNEWFKGLYEWIKASNLSPRYLNSYLKNTLNAHVHCIIPGTWYAQMKNVLSEICQQNIQGDENTKLVREWKGVELIDASGRPYRFSEPMMDTVIAYEMRRITELMSGEGKNQGKMYATTKWGEDGWKFEEFPGKFQEYFNSVINYDKRSDQVILAGKGISSSITNVENDGVISKSGSDVYYNYIIYLMSLTYDEYFVCKELNRALYMNFPQLKKDGIKIGFYIEIPDKQQDISPSDRLPQKVNPTSNQQ